MFATAWEAAKPSRAAGSGSRAERLDRALHAERICTDGAKRTFAASPRELPDGTIVATSDSAANSQPYLVHNGGLLPWSSSGYGRAIAINESSRVEVLTPRSTVATIERGYPVEIRLSG